MNKKPHFVNIALQILGFLLCVAPPALATVLYFPIWRSKGSEYILAGGGVLLIIIFALPIMKLLRRAVSSCASYTLWIILFALFFVLSRIASEMVVIAFAGLVGNLLGGLCFLIARMRCSHERKRI